MKFRKKPAIIEAIQYTGDNSDEVIKWANRHNVTFCSVLSAVIIDTLEGAMACRKNDWLIKGTAGEFYPCKTDIFAAIYEAAE